MPVYLMRHHWSSLHLALRLKPRFLANRSSSSTPIGTIDQTECYFYTDYKVRRNKVKSVIVMKCEKFLIPFLLEIIVEIRGEVGA